MKDFGKCDICGAYSFLRGHKCDPVWHVQFAEGSPYYCEDNIPWKIHASDSQEAAEKFAEYWDTCTVDYIVIG